MDLAAQVSMMPAKPMSLPPIPIVTNLVSPLSASTWGGFVPPVTDCGPVMLSVVAPLQLTSVKPDECSTRRTSEG